MAKEHNGSAEDLERGEEKRRHGRSRERKEGSIVDRDEESVDERERKSSNKKRKHRHRGRSRRSSKRSRRSSSGSESDDYSSSSESYSESSSDNSSSDSDSPASSRGSEDEERRRRRRKRERERRVKEERRRRKKREEREKKKKKKNEKSKKKKGTELGKTGAVTNSWGKYGVIRETDMWNKRPEFTAWLAEVKKVNLESLANWEEKQMFKEFMEDHNTATFPSKKYYGLDAYHSRMMKKDIKKATKKHADIERTVFNDEELRRQEMLRAREKHKDEQVEALKRSMQTGMAQAMKEQAQLKEEMAYQYKLGNFEAAAAIQRRLDPDIAM